MPPSLTDLNTKIDQLNAQVDEKDKNHKDAMDTMDKEHKDAMENMEKKNHDAMEDEHKKTEDANKAMEDEKKNHEAVLKAVLKAMEEEDPEKRKQAIKEAVEVQHKDDVHTETAKYGDHEMKEMKEENKSMKAQLEYQNTIIKKPKLQILQATYEKAGTDEKTIKAYKAEWDEMTPQQLDGAIEKLKPLMESLGASVKETQEPISLGQSIEFTASTKSGNEEYSAKVDKMSTAELFA